MPLPLFNEFNILHPYLSLHYLDYFTAANKMNTKLYCTTTLMMSMMSANSNSGSNGARPTIENGAKRNGESHTNATSGGDATTDTAAFAANTFDPTRNDTNPNAPFGYTIGATNVLFKQRLYDDLDAFVDETDVDLKGNEVLKKQLQLTTADLRLIRNIAFQNVDFKLIKLNKTIHAYFQSLLNFRKYAF